MLKKMVFIAALALPVPAYAAEVTIFTVEEISSKDAQIGDPVAFTIEGCGECTATGEITYAEKRRNRARDGRLIIEVREVDGAPATGRLEVKGKNVASDIAAAGLYGLAGFLVKGSHAVIDAGTAVAAVVEGE